MDAGTSLSIVAVCVSGVSAFYARKQGQTPAQAAAETQPVAESPGSVERAEAGQRVRWAVDRVGSTGLALRNLGTDRTHDVAATIRSSRFVTGPIMDGDGAATIVQDVVEPGGSVLFSITTPGRHASDHELLVTWRGQQVPVAVPLPALDPALDPSLGPSLGLSLGQSLGLSAESEILAVADAATTSEATE